MSIYVIFGPPGAGKGTQSDLMEEKLGIKKLSTGDLLRQHIRKKTELGAKVEETMRQGKLVGDDLLYEIINSEIRTSMEEGKDIVLDGYPRKVSQYNHIGEMGYSVDLILNLKIDKDTVIERLSGRRLCSDCQTSYNIHTNPPKSSGVCDRCGSKNLVQREDDKPEKISVRFDVYHKETEPVLSEMGKEVKTIDIDANQDPQKVFNQIKDALNQFL